MALLGQREPADGAQRDVAVTAVRAAHPQQVGAEPDLRRLEGLQVAVMPADVDDVRTASGHHRPLPRRRRVLSGHGLPAAAAFRLLHLRQQHLQRLPQRRDVLLRHGGLRQGRVHLCRLEVNRPVPVAVSRPGGFREPLSLAEMLRCGHRGLFGGAHRFLTSFCQGLDRYLVSHLSIR
jgi:hypothetical protein